MIPLILGAIAIGTGAVGVGVGAGGISNLNEANEICQRAQKRHEDAVQDLQEYWEGTNKLAEEYGQFQLEVMMRTIGRFVDFIQRNRMKAKQSEKEFLEGLDGISIPQIKEYKTTALVAEEVIQGGVSAAIAGAAAGSGAVTLARNLGTVTVTKFFGLWATEVGISQLGGAAAWNATVAWLGGSSMAVGSTVLGGITLGPALMVGGFQLAGKGEEALIKAREYEAKVNAEIATIEAAKDFMQQVRRRINELQSLLESINNRAFLGLNELDSIPSFNKNRNAKKFQQVALLVKALAEIMKTPILDSEGKLNPVTATIQARYRTLGGN
jgi:hypothetical protein